MEWIIGESPTDLLSVSTGNSIDHGSRYTERQQFDAKRRLLDLVCNKDLHTYPLCLASTLSLAPRVKPVCQHHWLNIINAEPKRDLLV